jgi:hypothetical protein
VLHNDRDLLGEVQRPSDNPPAINRAPAMPARHQLPFSSKRTKQYQRDECDVATAQEANAYAKTLREHPNEQRTDHIAKLLMIAPLRCSTTTDLTPCIITAVTALVATRSTKSLARIGTFFTRRFALFGPA